MEKLILAHSVLRQIEYAAETSYKSEIERKAKALRHASENLYNWYEIMTTDSTRANPKRACELSHYGTVYSEKLRKARDTFFKLDVLGILQHVGKVQIVIDCFDNMNWIDMQISPYFSQSDVKSFGEFVTLYSLDVMPEIVTVGALADIEDLAGCNSVKIYELECRSANYKTDGNLFLISKRDIVTHSRHR